MKSGRLSCRRHPPGFGLQNGGHLCHGDDQVLVHDRVIVLGHRGQLLGGAEEPLPQQLAGSSVFRPASRSTSTSADGGSTNTCSEFGKLFRICRAPSISMSSTAWRPCGEDPLDLALERAVQLAAVRGPLEELAVRPAGGRTRRG